MLPIEALAKPENLEDSIAVAERARCILLLRERARSYEEKKLFHLSRALTSIAEEIGGYSICP